MSVGYNANANATVGSYCVAVGASALQVNSEPNMTAVGFAALSSNTTGTSSVAVGYSALSGCSTGTNNTACGYATAIGITSGSNNTAIGYEALHTASNVSSCTAVGSQALKANTATQMTAVGSGALSTNVSGTQSTAVGYDALTASTGSNNTALGYESGLAVAAGTNNTLLGNSTATTLTSGGYNTIIGSTAGSSYTGSESSNILINSSGIGGESNVIRIGTQGSSSGQQNIAYIVGPLDISGAITTNPPTSATATSSFGTSLTAGTPYQNPLGYDLLVNVCVQVTSATGATITLGVGPSTGPTTNTVIPTFTTASPTNLTFSAIVPGNYWILVNTTGTISVGLIATQACPL